MSLHFSIDTQCWAILCDHSGCRERIHGIGLTDSAQRRHATAEAEMAGWQLSSFENQKPDHCKLHFDTKIKPLPVTRLYRDDGTPIQQIRRA